MALRFVYINIDDIHNWHTSKYYIVLEQKLSHLVVPYLLTIYPSSVEDLVEVYAKKGVKGKKLQC